MLRKSLLPLSLLPRGIEEYLESLSITRGELFMISKGNHKSMPAQLPRGFPNNITSHLFQRLIVKCIKFLNKDKSYNFGTKPKNNKTCSLCYFFVTFVNSVVNKKGDLNW